MSDIVDRLKALDDSSGYLQPEIGEAISEITRLRALLDDADGYLEADDAEGRDDPGNIRRQLRAAFRGAR